MFATEFKNKLSKHKELLHQITVQIEIEENLYTSSFHPFLPNQIICLQLIHKSSQQKEALATPFY